MYYIDDDDYIDHYWTNYDHSDEKLVKTRKPHECCFCGHTIKVGDLAWYYEAKEPRYESDADDNEVQVGIEYIKLWQHMRGDEDCEAARRAFDKEHGYDKPPQMFSGNYDSDPDDLPF